MAGRHPPASGRPGIGPSPLIASPVKAQISRPGPNFSSGFGTGFNALPPQLGISEDRWHQPLSEPRRSFGITAALTAAALVWSTFTPPPVQTTIGWFAPLSTPVFQARVTRGADLVEPVSTAAETVSIDRWLQGLSTPVWPKSGLAAAQQQAYTAPASEAKETVTVDRWLIGLSTPLYAKSSVQAASQQAYTGPVSAPPAVVAVSGWGQPLAQPYPAVRGLHASQQHAFAPGPISEAKETVTVDRWLIGLSNPVWARSALPAAQQSAFWWSGLTPPPLLASTVSAWGQDLSRPYPAARWLHVSQQQAFAPEPVSEAAESVSIDRWLIGLNLPVWARPALITASQTAYFAPTLTIDHTSVDRWHASLSLPVWPRPGLNATEQRSYIAPLSESPETTTVDRWHAAFSLPVWPKRGLYATEQQYQTAPLSEAHETTTVDRWHQPFSVPVQRRSFPVYQLQAQIIFTPIAAPVSIGWFQSLSIPAVLPKVGLHESFRPPTFFIPFIPSPDREIIGQGGVRLIYGKGQNRSVASDGNNRLAIKGKS